MPRVPTNIQPINMNELQGWVTMFSLLIRTVDQHGPATPDPEFSLDDLTEIARRVTVTDPMPEIYAPGYDLRMSKSQFYDLVMRTQNALSTVLTAKN